MSGPSIGPRSRKLLNFVAFQGAWWACVLGAAEGVPLLGPAVVLAWVSVQLACSERLLSELAVIASVVVLGVAADAALVAVDATRFTQPAVLGTASPPWMLALWANFAATLGSSLGWLTKRPLAAVVLGAAGGPAAYLGAAAIGAIELTSPRSFSVTAVAVAWALAVPACFFLRAVVLGRRSGGTASVGAVHRDGRAHEPELSSLYRKQNQP